MREKKQEEVAEAEKYKNKHTSEQRTWGLQLSHCGSWPGPARPGPARPAGTSSTLYHRPKWRLGSGVDLQTRARRKWGGARNLLKIYYNIKLLPPLLPLDKIHIHQGCQKLCHLNILHNIYFNYFFLGVSEVAVQSFQRQLI